MRIFLLLVYVLIFGHHVMYGCDAEQKIQQVLMDCSARNLFESEKKCLRKGLLPLILSDNVPGCSRDLLNVATRTKDKNACLRNWVRMSCGRKSARLLNGCGSTTVPEYENICLQALLKTSCDNPLGPHMVIHSKPPKSS